jgi:Flp pilus assembly protein TadD
MIVGIDAVFTWVDGADPDFCARRDEYAAQNIDYSETSPWRARSGYTGISEANERAVLSESTQNSSQLDSRFRNADELRFALRAIEANAPWIDRIFLVTNGQVPDWLDLDNPRIRLVRHSDIFEQPDTSLPTFNSNAIELNLHRIPGLADEFIYFNDDFFLGRPVTEADFRSDDGRYFMFVEGNKPLPLAMVDRSLVGHMWAFNHSLLNERLGKKGGRTLFAHSPQMYNRRLWQEVLLQWWEECDHTLTHRFRTPFDVAVRILYTYYVSQTKLRSLSFRGADSPGIVTKLQSKDYIFVKLGDDRTEFDEDLRTVLMRRPKFFCINDEIRAKNPDDEISAGMALRSFLLGYFPNPSSFERQGWEYNAALANILPAIVPTETMAEPVAFRLISWSGDGAVLRSESQDGELTPFEIGEDAALALTREDVVHFPLGLEGETVLLEMEPIFDEQLSPYAGFPRTERLVLSHHIGTQGFPVDAAFADYASRLQRFTRVMQGLAPLLDNPSSDPMAHFLAADRAIRSGKVDASVDRRLDYAQAGGIDTFWVCHRRALLQLRQGQRDGAGRNISFALQVKPDSAVIFTDLADLLAERGQYIEADVVASAVLDVLPQDAVARYIKSLCRFHFDDPDPDAWSLVGEDAPPRAIALWADIQIRERNGNVAVLGVLAAAIERYKDSLDLRLSLVRLSVFTGQQAQAANVMPSIAKLVGDNIGMLALARREHALGNDQGALLLLDASRARFGWLPDATAFWAQMLVNTGYHGRDVLEALVDHVAVRPDDRDAAVQLARLFMFDGRASDALAALANHDLDDWQIEQIRNAALDHAQGLDQGRPTFFADVAAVFPQLSDLHAHWARREATWQTEPGREDEAGVMALDRGEDRSEVA